MKHRRRRSGRHLLSRPPGLLAVALGALQMAMQQLPLSVMLLGVLTKMLARLRVLEAPSSWSQVLT